MDISKILLSTTASDAHDVAKRYGCGIEIAEFCTAWNMDDEFPAAERMVCSSLEGIGLRTLHGPYNELFPCAIDRKARGLAAQRYRQAIELAKGYGAQKVIIHGGYNPWIYYPVWYVEQSVAFWKEFFTEEPGVQIVLENVLETDPQWLVDIVRGVDHPCLKLCLDIGHVNAYSEVPLSRWLELWAPHISHFHIHNNDGSRDLHNPLGEGTIPMAQMLRQAVEACPEATFTLELMEAESSMGWLTENKLI